MRKVFFVLIFLFFVFSLSAAKYKPKLAIMEFEDASQTLDKKMLVDAAEYLRGEFVSANRFIVVAKERQDRMLYVRLKQESRKKCYDENCQIPLGQALSADHILKTTINYFGGIYTITTELIDLAKEATIKGARFKFDGTEQGLMKAMDRIAVQLAGKTISFNPGVLHADEVKGVKLGGLKLTMLPEVKIAVDKFKEFSKHPKMKVVTADTKLALEADADVMVAYDNALKADKLGEKNPKKAMRKWKILSEMEGKNPFRQKAKERYDEWVKMLLLKKMAKDFEQAKIIDKYGKLFPDSAISAWKKLAKNQDNNPYFEIANKRLVIWKNFRKQILEYKIMKKKFQQQRVKDQEKLIKVLPLSFLQDAQKRAMMVQYMEIYAPFYGVDDIETIFSQIPQIESKKLMTLLYNDYLEKEMQKKCHNNNASACYISASLSEMKEPEKAVKFFKSACANGVVDACIKTGKIYYNKGDKKATSFFTTACGWGSPEGCNIIGFLTEIGFGTKKNKMIASKLYLKACKLGYKISCNMYSNIKKYGFSSDQVRNIIAEKQIEFKISKKGVNDIEKLSSRHKFNNSNFGDTRLSIKVKEKYRPYLKTGIILSVIGVGLSVGGFFGFNAVSSHQYDLYLKNTTDIAISNAILQGKTKEDYLEEINKYKTKGDRYKTLAITSGITGGILAISGIVLILIPREREILKKVSFFVSDNAFYAQLNLNF